MQTSEKGALGTSERRERIIQQLRSNGSVQVNELASHYQVSTVTIRNDLAFLEKQGVAVRAYGGALLCEPGQTVPERTIADKSVLNTPVKQRIGALAATLVLRLSPYPRFGDDNTGGGASSEGTSGDPGDDQRHERGE